MAQVEAKRCARIDFAEVPGGAPIKQPMANGAMAAIDKKAFVIGGYSTTGSIAQVAEYDTATKQWSRSAATLPSPRSEASAAVLGGHVILFGGWDDTDVLASTLVISAQALADGKPAWETLAAAQNSSSGAPAAPDAADASEEAAAPPAPVEPPARRMHSMVAYQPTGEGAEPCLFLFGGFTSETRLNDLWRFDLKSMSWTQIEVRGFVPSPRDSAVLAADPENGQLLLFGGYTSCRVNELFTFDIESATWARQPTAMPPSARFGCFGAVNNGHLLVGMGQDARGPTAAIFALKLAEWKWAVAPLEGDELEPRIHFSACLSDGGKRVIVAGGSTNTRQCTSTQEIELERIEVAGGGPAKKK